MAPKALSRSRELPKEKPENEESSSGEEESEDEGSDSHSSEEEREDLSGGAGEDEVADLKMVKSKIKSKSVNQEESGSDSESDLDSPSNYKLQPISKPHKSSSKRAHQQDDESQRPVRSNKKSKAEEGGSFGSSPSNFSGCITRLWSDDDEVTVLNGMVDFRNTKGQDPSAYMWAFYDFIKGKLNADFSRDQLKTKIRRLKSRFLNALKRRENGEAPVFSKPHEVKAFEISRKIWGHSDNARKNAFIVDNVELGENESVEQDGEEGSYFRSKYRFLSGSFNNLKWNIPSLGMSESGMSFALKRLGSIGNGKAKELDEKWKQLIMEEVELNHKKMTLMKEQMRMALYQ